MGAFATLSESALEVEPGTPVTVGVTVRNTGTVVDAFKVEPLGEPAPWATVNPPTLSLFPGAEGMVWVTFTPPRLPSTVAGPQPFALKVWSNEDPEGTVVEEGVLAVGTFRDTSVEILPRTSHARGRKPGKHELAIDNRGNTRLNASLTALDKDALLRFALLPPALVVEPGTAGLVRLEVRAKKPFWRGQAKTRPFQVFVEPDDDPPLAVEGTFLNEPRIPAWLPRLLLALLALLLLAALLWKSVLEPTVEDRAREAGAKAGQEAAAAAVNPLADAVDAQGRQIAETLGKPAPKPVPRVTASPAPQFVDPALGNPFSTRLQVLPGGGSNPQVDATVFGSKDIFNLTDIVLSNPRGHEGLLTLRRGDDTLFQSDLANFRDLDYHFVAPLVFAPGEELEMEVSCTKPDPGKCEASVFVSGYLRPAPPS